MADVEENWQSEISTIRERAKFIFNNELLSDVKFVVPASNEEFGESKEDKRVIPAHKFVLAISSPVFYSMFYGLLAETAESIELPDCEYESLLELFRYMYSDEVILCGNNVMQVFYLAKKYMVPSLADKCRRYMQDNLEGSNVFSILQHAQKFEDKDLEERCWEVIKTQTGEAVTSDEFVTLERSLIEAVVKMEKLCIKEVELFKAVDCWATKEIERQGLSSSGDVKRQILGEEIVKEIRFPLMSQKEFASVVPDCNILTMREVVDMMKYYNDVLTTPVPFKELSRFGPLLRVARIGTCKPPIDMSPDMSRYVYTFFVTTSKTIVFRGVQFFGRKGGQFQVNVDVVEDTENSSSLVNQSGTYISKVAGVFDVMFDEPFCLENGKIYKIKSSVNGPSAWQGSDERAFVKHKAGVTFTFTKNNDVHIPCPDIPILFFSLC